MNGDEMNPDFQDRPRSDAPDDLPPVEDAAEPEETASIGSADEEAEAAALSLEARALDGWAIESAPLPAADVEPTGAAPAVSARGDAPEEGTSDTGSIADQPVTTAFVSRRFRKGELEHEFSAHNIAVELSRIEDEVRQLLDERDPRRKRKFSGTRHWHEVEEDLISLRFTGRIDEETVRSALQLIAQRHFLFRQLRYVASTRPTWNT